VGRSTELEIMSITGHRSPTQAERYAANKIKLATAAILSWSRTQMELRVPNGLRRRAPNRRQWIDAAMKSRHSKLTSCFSKPLLQVASFFRSEWPLRQSRGYEPSGQQSVNGKAPAKHRKRPRGNCDPSGALAPISAFRRRPFRGDRGEPNPQAVASRYFQGGLRRPGWNFVGHGGRQRGDQCPERSALID
jgi:hypothetical protein